MVIRAEIFAGIVPLSTGIATSNLDHEIRRGDHRRAGGGAGKNRTRTQPLCYQYFDLLVQKAQDFARHLADSASIQALDGRGDLANRNFSSLRTALKGRERRPVDTIFAADFLPATKLPAASD
jgi:hypothetical protein